MKRITLILFLAALLPACHVPKPNPKPPPIFSQSLDSAHTSLAQTF